MIFYTVDTEAFYHLDFTHGVERSCLFLWLYEKSFPGLLKSLKMSVFSGRFYLLGPLKGLCRKLDFKKFDENGQI